MSAVGSNELGKVFLGSTEVSKIYKGSTLVFDGNSGPVVPSYDSEIEYLGYNGNQYIDTGITPNETIEAEIKIVPTNARAASTGLFSARNSTYPSSGSTVFSLSLWINGRNVALNDSNYDSGWVSNAMTYNTEAVLKISNRQLYVNGTLKKTSTSSNTFNFNVTYGLLRSKHANNTWDTRQGSSGKLYYAKIWKNGTLVRNFIPVRVGQVGYLLDTISNNLFGNLGTGSFTLGDDITT